MLPSDAGTRTAYAPPSSSKHPARTTGASWPTVTPEVIPSDPRRVRSRTHSCDFVAPVRAAVYASRANPNGRGRGLLDIAAPIASAPFSTHPATDEETFQGLARQGVLRPDTGDVLRGLGGFRNVLAHEYLEIDHEELVRWRSRILSQGSPVIAQVQEWLGEGGA